MNMSALVGSLPWNDFVAAVALKGAAILTLAFIATRVLRRQPAAVRHGVWLAAILAQLATPLLGRVLPTWSPMLPAWAPSVALAPDAAALPTVPQSTPADAAIEPSFAAQAVVAPTAPAPTAPAPTADTPAPNAVAPVTAPVRVVNWAMVAFGVWAVGAGLVLLWLVAGSFGVALIARRAERVTDGEWLTLATRLSNEMGLGRPVVLLRGRGLAVPVTWGVLVPVVLLPMNADEWSAETRRTVLLHELAHVRRFDMLSQLAAHVVLAICWFDPLVWMGVRAMRAESERACDDTVLRHGTEPSAYVNDLLSIVRSARPTRVPALAALAMARPTEFEGRVLAILDATTSRRAAGRAAKLATVLASLVVVAPLAAMRPGVAEPPRANEMVTQSAQPPAQGEQPAQPESGPQLEQESQAARTQNPVNPQVSTQISTQLSSRISARVAEHVAAQAAMRGFSFQPPVGAAPTPMPTPSPMPFLSGWVASSWNGVRTPKPAKEPKVKVSFGRQSSAQTGAAVEPLIGALTDSDAQVRRSAAHALGEIEDPRAVDALTQALRRDADAGVRETAAWALGQLEDRRAVAALGEALRSDQSASVRNKAAWALGQIEDRSGVDALGAALRDADAAVRRTAVWALGQIEDERAVPFLVPALTNADPETRKQAAWALGQIESGTAVDGLVAALRDANASVKSTAAWALGQIEDARAVPGLSAALKDATPEVRKQAAWALGQIESPAAVPALVAALDDSDRNVKKTAAWALGEIEDPAAANGLAALTRSSDAEMRRVGVQSLARIGGVASVEALVALLKDPDPEVRRAAVQALGRR